MVSLFPEGACLLADVAGGSEKGAGSEACGQHALHSRQGICCRGDVLWGWKQPSLLLLHQFVLS